MKDYFNLDASKIKEKKLYLLDMDGTIYNDGTLFDGAKEFLADIKDRGAKYVFITNNSSKSVDDYVKKVRGMGIDVNPEDFFTSAQAAALLIKKRYENATVYAQGTKSFIDGLIGEGIKVTTEFDENVGVILVGFDTELSGEKLRTTSKALTLLKDAAYLATNPDWVCPVDFGYIPDCGSMCFGYEKATGRKPEFIGKPSPTMINVVMERHGVKKDEVIVVGDRIYTDIASGVNAGVDTACVLSGEVSVKDVMESQIKPTYVFNSVKDMIIRCKEDE